MYFILTYTFSNTIMANLLDIIQWCNIQLKTNEFKDYAPNGLQIEGRTEVKKNLMCCYSISNCHRGSDFTKSRPAFSTSWLFLER